TFKYKSTVYIPKPSRNPKGQKWTTFTPPATTLCRRYRGRVLLRRSHAVVAAMDAARNSDHNGPRVIIFDTTMCKGVPFLEQREITHFVRVDADEWGKALDVLEEGKPA
ncbi:hypothetical protein AB9K37_04210, partial [Donghicola sp. XS_ASV15]